MLNPSSTKAPTGLNADQDGAQLLRKLAIAIFGAAFVLAVSLMLMGLEMRPSVFLAMIVAVAMLLLLRAGHLNAAAYALCWGLLLAAGVAVFMFGIRATGGLLIPLAIMTGGWLLGRGPAIFLAVAGSLLSVLGYYRHVGAPLSAMPPITFADVLGHFAIFLVGAMMAGAMATTLRRQYDKVNALAIDLQESNANLEDRVVERSVQLASMQQKVMDTEKLTSLGAMVAGISHELNTPLGNALTVSTALEAQVHQLKQCVESGQLSRADMTKFLTDAGDMAHLTTQSITRAAELVASFKQVAVDQTSEQRRSFQLDQVIADNIAALRPSVGRSDVEISVNVPDGITCDTYPGPLGQVVTNLVQNALVHGLDGHSQGRVEVLAFVQGNQVHLVVTDNGCGMEPQVFARVFEPFFTTRLGKGGSGLGLALSHRIATSVLGGQLTVRSQLGQGSAFTLTFPKRLSGSL